MYRLILAIFTMATSYASAATYKIDPAESLFAVITQKDGLAAAFAHNHLVVAPNPTVQLTTDPNQLESTEFSFVTSTVGLVSDDMKLNNKWFPLVQSEKILSEPFTEISPSNRSSIRSSMLGAEQLDAENYPTISATLTRVIPNPLYPDRSSYSNLATLTVTIHGTTLSRVVPVNFAFSGDHLEAQSVQAFKFTDFGMEPFSALFGAVKNKNQFHILVKVAAARVQ